MNRYISLGFLRQVVSRPSLTLKLPRYVEQLRAYRKMEFARGLPRKLLRIYPCLEDDNAVQWAHNYYFYQDCWAAKQVFREKPAYMVDVGSTVLLAGILSQFTRCISIDIRPVMAKMDGLVPLAASVLQLPFGDNVIPCLTTMCVLEHIGLGRFGDPLNPSGTANAVAEITRVVAPGGIVVYSVPVGRELLEFNANRRFTYEQASEFFGAWEIVDSCVLSPSPIEFESTEKLLRIPDPVACFCVRKPINPA